MWWDLSTPSSRLRDTKPESDNQKIPPGKQMLCYPTPSIWPSAGRRLGGNVQVQSRSQQQVIRHRSRPAGVMRSLSMGCSLRR